jgi:AcrR family transcriptional regulator
MKGLLSRHERRKQRTRRKLLDAARQVIAEHGYDATGVLDITESADVSKGTFYLHFKDKEDLTHTLITEGFDALRVQLDEAFDRGQPGSQMADALQTVFRYAAENRDLFRIMLGRQASAELNMMAFSYFTTVVKDIIGRSMVMSEPLPFPPELLAQYIAGAGVRLGLWWIEDDHGLSPDEISSIMYRLLSKGVLDLLSPDLRRQLADALPQQKED